jgi:uncharacterized membrane protein YvbJ
MEERRRYCKNCGAEIAVNSNYCSRCGIGFDNTQSPVSGVKTYRKIAWAVTFWMLAMFVIVGVFAGLEVGKNPLTQAVAIITVLSMLCTFVAWSVYGIQEYRKPKEQPKTAYEAELHRHALENRRKIMVATAIILAVGIGILILWSMVSIQFVITPSGP